MREDFEKPTFLKCYEMIQDANTISDLQFLQSNSAWKRVKLVMYEVNGNEKKF